MAIELNFKEEDIAKMVQDAILQASIGKALNEAIKKALTKDGYQDSPFQKGVNEAVADLVRRYVHEEGPIRDALEAAVKSAMDQTIKNGTIEKLATDFAEKLRLDRY